MLFRLVTKMEFTSIIECDDFTEALKKAQAKEVEANSHNHHGELTTVRVAPPVTVRDRLVAEYLVTVTAPSQSTTDEESRQVARDIEKSLPDMIAFLSAILPNTYDISIDQLATGMTCGACDRPVPERVASAAQSNTDMMQAVDQMENHRQELMGLLRQIATNAHETEDASDFVLWVQDKLAAYR